MKNEMLIIHIDSVKVEISLILKHLLSSSQRVRYAPCMSCSELVLLGRQPFVELFLVLFLLDKLVGWLKKPSLRA